MVCGTFFEDCVPCLGPVSPAERDATLRTLPLRSPLEQGTQEPPSCELDDDEFVVVPLGMADSWSSSSSLREAVSLDDIWARLLEYKKRNKLRAHDLFNIFDESTHSSFKRETTTIAEHHEVSKEQVQRGFRRVGLIVNDDQAAAFVGKLSGALDASTDAFSFAQFKSALAS